MTDIRLNKKEQLAVKSKRNFAVRNAAAHTQSPMEGEVATSAFPVVSSDNTNSSTPSHLQNDDKCMKTLISLLDRALSQNSQAEMRHSRPSQPPMRACKVCHSSEHSTLAHCRRHRLCLACFQPGHIQRDCAKIQPSNGKQFVQPPQSSPTLK